MKYCTLHLRQPDRLLHPMQRFIRDEDVVSYEELLAWNVRPGEPTEYELFYAEVTDADRYLAAVEDVESIRWHRSSRASEDSLYVFVCQETREDDVAFRRAFGRLELIVVPPIIYDDDAAMALTVVGQEADLGALIESVPADIDVRVAEVGTYNHPHTTIVGRLTDRQTEAVEAATDLGYYDVPRTASLAAVADALDCAESTASTLLRKAESSVMPRLLER